MRRFAVLVAVLLPGSALAQHHHQPATSYAAQETRAIKALSAQQVADLQAGRGMGLALPAELNGYPGPMHVLELAEPLALTTEQRERTAALIAAMKAEAVALGERVIATEADLDRLFADGRATPGEVAELTRSIGLAQAALRASHLRYHLEMATLLDEKQRERYAVLRGYRR